jgi:hypothetical protein
VGPPQRPPITPPSRLETVSRELGAAAGLAVDPDHLAFLDTTVERHPLGRYNSSTTYRTTAERTTGRLAPETPDDELEWFPVEQARTLEDEFVPAVVGGDARRIADE